MDKKVLDWPTRHRIALGAARGISYLHHDCIPHIIHRDIKSSNILLDQNMEARVSDFGLATLMEPNKTHVSTIVAGTFGYLAPGIINTSKINIVFHFQYSVFRNDDCLYAMQNILIQEEQQSKGMFTVSELCCWSF